ncbi:phage tail domain-containing protein [Bacillus sp. AM 13(2015)]|uniref:phage tail domain-containing protein n=1 Tax=Bacillus sp. AM 13(2015) TaxID=1739115 RepID=UPI000750EFF5|nr:phage tail domain-containing protein [Bacillus sp. AM 13(2015)]KUR61175.1 phage tail protein [Bacillus sp. AM 13(2015)]
MDLYFDFRDGMGEQPLSGLLPYFKLLSFAPDAPSTERELVQLTRFNGLVPTQHPRDIVYKERSIKVEILLDAKIAANFYQYRHEFYDLVVQPFWYYISCDLLPGRRFAVTCDGGFTIPKDKQKNQVSFQVDFNNITGLAESKGTSLSAQNFSNERWFSGMNIQRRDDLQYRFKNKKRFSVFNPGVPISPLQHDYNVLLNAKGKNVTIINHTNNERLKIEADLKKSQQVRNLKQYTVVGNKRLKTSGRIPSLDKGMNEFEIQNTSDFEIVFDTRFYFP